MTTFHPSVSTHHASASDTPTGEMTTTILLSTIIQEQLAALESLAAEGRAQIHALQAEVTHLAIELHNTQTRLANLSALLLTHERLLATLKASMSAAPAGSFQEAFIPKPPDVEAHAPRAESAVEQVTAQNGAAGDTLAPEHESRATADDQPAAPHGPATGEPAVPAGPARAEAPATSTTPAVPTTPATAAHEPARVAGATHLSAPRPSAGEPSPRSDHVQAELRDRYVGMSQREEPSPRSDHVQAEPRPDTAVTKTSADAKPAGSATAQPQPGQPVTKSEATATVPAHEQTDSTATKTVQRGSKVEVIFDSDPDRSVETYTIVHSTDARPMQNMIADNSPLGRALLGARPGEVRRFRVRSGPEQVVVVRAVR